MARYTQLQKNDIQKIAGDYDLNVVDFEYMQGGIGNSSY